MNFIPQETGAVAQEGDILRGTARELASIIDDIDTAFDIFKPEEKSFEKYVWMKIKEARKYFTSDGYELYEVKQDGKNN
jgi:hypothetical protein